MDLQNERTVAKMDNCRYRLQRKDSCASPNILGNCSMPVHTYRWIDIAMCGDLEQLISYAKKDGQHRIIDTHDF